ncbi:MULTISPECIES: LysR family transcriptional regulator [Halomonas]|uniref:Transcriptional regulator n=1 Tax=Halomonas halophila TaxID=29573 RepID=A0ABQ0U0D5_9GAMM|nr:MULTISPECIES: LysR substrate-binding domain-containing protein [Halomonas]MDR5888631.1 LysR substrate-binding domain-containing protein [Halomonas salina]WJY07812.1 LysR substrate-binding domain-containing protein [Halomonas halophila]GEK72007.1 transcriptional regulator [Halomonas halophila]
MDLETLRIFEAVAAELSMTRAAARLGRAPSNVTTRIQQLEAELDAELFVRLGKRITLSTAGQRFLAYAQRLLALEDEARQAVGGDDGGSLRIGSMESTAASRLPAPLAAFNRAHPATRLEVSTGPSGPLMDEVRDGRLDCAFVALPAELENEPALAEMGLQSVPVWEESLLLLLPPVDAEATAPAELITRTRPRTLAAFKPGCTYRAMAEQRLGIVAGSEWRIQELGSYHAMVAAVAAGACVTLLPRSVLELCRVPDDLATLEMGTISTRLLWRRGYETPAFQAFAGEFLGETDT